MHMVPVSPVSSAELAVAALAAAPVLASVIIRIVLCVLAASATRKGLEDPSDGQAASLSALRAHRLAVLRAILSALSAGRDAKPSEEDSQVTRHGSEEQPALPGPAQSRSEIRAGDLRNWHAG